MIESKFSSSTNTNQASNNKNDTVNVINETLLLWAVNLILMTESSTQLSQPFRAANLYRLTMGLLDHLEFHSCRLLHPRSITTITTMNCSMRIRVKTYSQCWSYIVELYPASSPSSILFTGREMAYSSRSSKTSKLPPSKRVWSVRAMRNKIVFDLHAPKTQFNPLTPRFNL